jgi:hypothetical protein
MVRFPAIAGAVPVYVATPEEFRAIDCVTEPMVKRMLPVGVVMPLAGVTVAVSVYVEPANSDPLGLIPSCVVVPAAITVSLSAFEVLEENSAEP